MEDRVLDVQDVAKSFVAKRDVFGRASRRVDAVNGVSFVVRRGETVAIVGESGAGKSTVGRLILRLIEPDRGSVHLSGVDMLGLSKADLRRMRAKARMIFQDPYSSLDPMMTIGDILAEDLIVHDLGNRAERDEQVLALLSRLGMGEHLLERYPHEFSGGQLQRVAVARAVITNPDLIVCDEPVAALDMSIRAQVINLLRELQVEYRMGYVFITHDLSLVRLIAQEVLVMYHGEIVEAGPTSRIFEDPKHAYTQRLLAAVPIPDPARRHRRHGLDGDPVVEPIDSAPRTM